MSTAGTQPQRWMHADNHPKISITTHFLSTFLVLVFGTRTLISKEIRCNINKIPLRKLTSVPEDTAIFLPGIANC